MSEGPAGRALAAYLAGSIAVTLLLTAAALVAGGYTVFFTTVTSGVSASTPYQPYVWVGPVAFPLPLAVPLGGVFVAFLAVYAGLLLAAARSGGALVSSVRRSWSEGLGAAYGNGLVVSLAAAGFLTLTGTVADSVLQAAGVPVGGLNGSDMAVFASATTAPLLEEFGFRVCIVGVVALLVSGGGPARSRLMALWRPASAYEGETFRAGREAAVWTALIGSAVVFGMAHVASGSGWALGKLPEAAYGGAVLGYVYVRWGFGPAVIAHWGLDYLGTAFAFYGEGAYGVPWASWPGFVWQQAATADLLAGVGLAAVLSAAYFAWGRVRVWSEGRRDSAAPNP